MKAVILFINGRKSIVELDNSDIITEANYDMCSISDCIESGLTLINLENVCMIEPYTPTEEDEF